MFPRVNYKVRTTLIKARMNGTGKNMASSNWSKSEILEFSREDNDDQNSKSFHRFSFCKWYKLTLPMHFSVATVQRIYWTC